MKIFPLFISLFLFISTAYSETPQYHDVLMHNAATATGDGTMLNVHNANVVRVDVQITGTATVTFKIAGPGNFGPYEKLCTPSNSTTRVTSTSSTGVYYCRVAAGNVFIARVSAYTDGTVTVVGRASTAQ
jgi:ABC-type uncharacterized transport system permease subunit